MDGIREIIADSGVPAECVGHAPFPFVVFRHERADTNHEVATLYMQEMARRNVFAVAVNYLCAEHTERDIDQVLKAAGGAFGTIAKALDSGSVKSFLGCPVRQSGFKRLV
jgi:glutamate-1-semialdehyde aminotransferase